MPRSFPRFLRVVLLLLPTPLAWAQKVADLPAPTAYVEDFAQVLSPQAHRNLEDLCVEVHNQADAVIEVVTVKTIGDASIEQYTADLEEKWKLGKKGEDRSTLIVLSVDPRRLRVEVGYGLEGILNDAKVGRILDTAIPAARTGDYDQAMTATAQGLANVIAADKGVTLQPIVHQYHRQAVSQTIGPVQIVLGIGFVILILILIRTGHIGWAFYLLMSMMGGGGGGGARDDDDRGGGFGGVGGGSSGGGGASRDF
jgi:uncharacterized protein